LPLRPAGKRIVAGPGHAAAIDAEQSIAEEAHRAEQVAPIALSR